MRRVSRLADGGERVEMEPESRWEERYFPPGARVFTRCGECVLWGQTLRDSQLTCGHTIAAPVRASAPITVPVDPALVDAFAHAMAAAPSPTRTKRPEPRRVTFAEKYPDAAERGRRLGMQQRLRFPGDPYGLAASLGYSVRLVRADELPAFPGGQHAQALLKPTERRILVDVSLDSADRARAVAHECGHVLTGYARRPMQQLVATGWDDPDEVAAEAFAFAFMNIQS